MIGGELRGRPLGLHNVIGGELRGRPLGLHTSGQTLKVKGFQSAYMVVLFGTFGAKSLTS